MINKIQVAALVAALSGCLVCCKVHKSVPTALTRTTMGIGTGTPAKNVRVIMSADTAQKRSDKGLQFSLKLQNDSAAAVEIVNPLDLFGVNMFDTAWKEVQFPYRGRQRGHDHGWKNNTFVVNRVKINGRSADIDTFVKAYNVTIPGNSKVEIFMGITNVLKPGAVRPFTVEQTIPVPAGKYTVIVTSSLMEGSSSVILHMPPVKIEYK